MEKKEVEQGGRQSCIQARHIIISRSDPKVTRGSRIYSSRSSSVNVRNSISPGVYQQLSSSGIIDFRDNRDKEKREMQDLNQRLASYIDQVHYQHARIKNLEAENDALRNRKTEDFQPIRAAYENEIRRAREVIDELGISKGHSETKVAGLQDEIASLREYILTLEKQAEDYRKKINTFGNQIGEYEGELQTLRHRIGSLEDENAKIRQLLENVQAQCRRIRSDLDVETVAHIKADCLAQTKTEEAEFYRDLVEQFELMKPEPVLIKGMGYADFWKSELAKCVRDIQAAYDEKIEIMQQECEFKYTTQINQLRFGNVKDDMQLSHSQEECKKLKSQILEKNATFAEFTSKLASIQGERDGFAYQMNELQRELEDLRIKYNQDLGAKENELQGVLEQVQSLTITMNSLELEIAIYKKLLEGEEQRVGLSGYGLRSLVEQALILGAQEKEAAILNDVIQSSTLRESTGSLTIQRASKGPIGFASLDHNGGNVVIENTTSGTRTKSQSLKGWKLVKTTGGQTTIEVDLKDLELTAGRQYTVWAKGAKDRATADNEQIADVFSFGVGTCIWKLLDEAGNEKATLTAKFIG